MSGFYNAVFILLGQWTTHAHFSRWTSSYAGQRRKESEVYQQKWLSIKLDCLPPNFTAYKNHWQRAQEKLVGDFSLFTNIEFSELQFRNIEIRQAGWPLLTNSEDKNNFINSDNTENTVSDSINVFYLCITTICFSWDS